MSRITPSVVNSHCNPFSFFVSSLSIHIVLKLSREESRVVPAATPQQKTAYCLLTWAVFSHEHWKCLGEGADNSDQTISCNCIPYMSFTAEDFLLKLCFHNMKYRGRVVGELLPIVRRRT